MIKLFCYCGFAVCVCISANAQECLFTLKGKVSDFHDNSPIVDASLHIENSNIYTTSNFDGNFEFKNLCKGKIVLIVSHISCETKRININMLENTYKTIVLEHHVEDLEEVIVKSNNSITSKTVQASKIDHTSIDEFSGKNLGDVLKNVAGIFSINTGNTIVKPIINGLHSSRVVVITNGVRLQDQDWGIEHAPNIDINNASEITVIKGASSLEFGSDAIGGVVVLESNRYFLKDSIFGKTILGFQKNGMGGNLHSSITKTTKKGLFFNAKGTLKRFGDFYSPNYQLTNSGLDSKSFSLQTGLKKFEKGFMVNYSFIDNKIGILKASHIGNIDDLVTAINTQQPIVIEDFSYQINTPRQEVSHHIFKIDYYNRFKDLGKLKVQYDFQKNQRFEFDVRVGDDRNKAAVDLNLITHAINSSFYFNSNSNSTYKVGLKGVYQNNIANPDTGIRRLIPDYKKVELGFFGIGNFTLHNRTTLNAAFRYDYNYIDAKKFYLKSRWNERAYNTLFSDLIIGDFTTQWLVNPRFSFHNIAASAGIVHQINDKHSILFNYALSNRVPNASELFSDGLHHSAARIELGDLNLQKEISNRFSSSYEFTSRKTNFLTEVFFNHIQNFMYLEPFGTEQTIRGAFPVWNYRATNANLWGLNITFQHQLNDFLSFSNISSLVYGYETKNSRDLIEIPAPNFRNSIAYQNSKWHAFTMSLESELVLKQQNYPDTNFSVFLPSQNTNAIVDISTPPQGYHLLHFNTGAVFQLSKKTDIHISATISNLSNTKYRDYLNRLRFFADDLGRNFTLQLKLIY